MSSIADYYSTSISGMFKKQQESSSKSKKGQVAANNQNINIADDFKTKKIFPFMRGIRATKAQLRR
eukprot:gene24501-10494_t